MALQITDSEQVKSTNLKFGHPIYLENIFKN